MYVVQKSVTLNGTSTIWNGFNRKMALIVGLVLLYFFDIVNAYNFTIGYEYHYRYRADSTLFKDDHRISTFVKVTYLFCILFLIFRKYLHMYQ